MSNNLLTPIHTEQLECSPFSIAGVTPVSKRTSPASGGDMRDMNLREFIENCK